MTEVAQDNCGMRFVCFLCMSIDVLMLTFSVFPSPGMEIYGRDPEPDEELITNYSLHSGIIVSK